MTMSELRQTFLSGNLFLGRSLRRGWVGSGSSRKDGRNGRGDGWKEGGREGEGSGKSRSNVTLGGGAGSRGKRAEFFVVLKSYVGTRNGLPLYVTWHS